MDKLFLLDAYALIYRAYYALMRSPRINSKGLNTSAIFGFVNTLNEVLTKENPQYMGVAFDIGKTFRHEAFPDYKAQREETPEVIKLSVPIIKDILKAFKISILEVEGFEADDVIGTLSHQASQHKDLQTFMVTPDKDYAQLAKSNVFMYKPLNQGGIELLNNEGIEKKYGIPSATNFIDMLALIGDSADNYPGCPGIGIKTATKLINQFGTIENLLQHTDELKGKMKKNVEESTEQIKMSKFLATIRLDAPIKLNLDELKLEEPNYPALKKIFAELEFKTLAKKILNTNLNDDKTAPRQLDLFKNNRPSNQVADKFSSFDSLQTIKHNYKLIDNKEDMIKIRDFFLTKNILSLDTETTSSDAMDAKLVGLSFSTGENSAFYVPIPEDEEKAKEIVNIFKTVYENPQIEKIGQNIKYDMQVLSHYDVSVKGQLFDTMIAHYVLQPELAHNLDYMAETMLHYKTIPIEQLIGPKGKNQKNMRDLPPEEIFEYAAEDADITLKLKNVLEAHLKDCEFANIFYDIEMPLVPVLTKMELNGVKIDTASLKETSTLLSDRMNEIEKEIHELAGETFNVSSPKQVGEILFGKLKIAERPKKTKTGQYVTSEDELLKVSNNHPIVNRILAYRGIKKLLSTYVDALPKLVNRQTGHIHTSFNQAVTATGRLSSSDPNLQNIPIRGEDGKEIRKCFIPEKGCLFFAADYSQIELRVMAHLSGDENMMEAFKHGFDIHAATAAKIFHIDIKDVTRDERTKAKRANFGIIYGITTYGLAQRLEIDNKEAKELIEGYFRTFPKVKAYMDQAIEKAKTKGYAETLFGRRRYLPDINSQNFTVRSYAERNAINAPIQGSAADIIKTAMINIYRRFKKENIRSKMILQVHDELDFSVYPDEKEQVEKIVLEEMQGAYKLNVPLIADAGWGNNWLEAH